MAWTCHDGGVVRRGRGDERARDAPALAAFYEDPRRGSSPGESVAVWMRHRANLATLLSAYRETAWKALCARTEEVGKMKNARCGKKAVVEEDARRAWSPWSPRHRSASSTMCARAAARHTPCAVRRPLAQRPRRDQGREGRRRGMEDLADRALALGPRARRGEGGDRPPDAPPPPDGTDGPTRRAAPRTTPRRPRVASRRPRHGRPRGARCADAWRLGDGDHRARREDRQHPAAVANSAGRNLGAIALEPLRTHAVHAYAGRLQRLSVDGDGSTLAWDVRRARRRRGCARAEGRSAAAAADADGRRESVSPLHGGNHGRQQQTRR